MKRLVFGLLISVVVFGGLNSKVLAVAGPTLRPTWIDDDFVTPTPTNTPIPTATPLPTSTPIPTLAPLKADLFIWEKLDGKDSYEVGDVARIALEFNVPPQNGEAVASAKVGAINAHISFDKNLMEATDIIVDNPVFNIKNKLEIDNVNGLIWISLSSSKPVNEFSSGLAGATIRFKMLRPGKGAIGISKSYPAEVKGIDSKQRDVKFVVVVGEDKYVVVNETKPTVAISCEWCGDECRDTRIKRMCSNLTPAPKDMDCKPMDGVCTVVGKPRTCLTCQEGVPPRSEGNANVEVNKCDNKIDLIDFGIWKAEYLMFKQGIKAVSGWKADFQCDEKIDLVDFGVWKVGYFKYKDLPLTTPVLTQTVKPTITSAPTAVPTLSGKLTCGARCTLNSQCESNDCRAMPNPSLVLGVNSDQLAAAISGTVKYCYCDEDLLSCANVRCSTNTVCNLVRGKPVCQPKNTPPPE